MSSLKQLLKKIREASPTERDKGTTFEKLIQYYLINDPKYDFVDVWLWEEWAELQEIDARDTGIDLVAKDRDTETIWAIQCKFYSEDAKIYKKDIDSFFTESGKKPFGHRLLVITTSKTSEHVQHAMKGQQIPCSTLNLLDLEDSSINWSKYAPDEKPEYIEPKKLRPHQLTALERVEEGFKTADRGQLRMACGTGKTFTALKIAEKLAGEDKRVLFLVPSLSLLSQTLTEWTKDSSIPLHCFAVCSDSSTGKRRIDDDFDITVTDLAYPATTKADKLAKSMEKEHPGQMTVVFSTYQSIQVISQAQKKHDLPEFDLIICDEAHRTTGATLSGEDESNFVRVHDQDFIQGKKRLYMTATPRIFGDAVKAKADEHAAVLCSMDDPELFGEPLYTLNFSAAVKLGLLSDYKVLVLAVDEGHISSAVQRLLSDGNELKLDDAAKIVGCWKALAKQGLEENLDDDPDPMHRAVAFCRDIKTSKKIAKFFPEVVEEYLNEGDEELYNPLQCQLDHVDGSFNAVRRRTLLDWLSTDHGSTTCSILSNARCLSEGVDVPSLDAILFLNPRRSQVDVVQSVGRVMRRAPGKTRGYVILPVGVPPDIPPHEALNNNEKYKVVWQILNALRSHDDELDAEINKLEFGISSKKMEVVAVTKNLKRSSKSDGEKGPGIGEGNPSGDGETVPDPPETPRPPVQLTLIGEFEKAIYAKIVKKCGTRTYWEDWAGDIAKIAGAHITRINAALEKSGSKEKEAFDTFLEEIRDDLNESITKQDAVEMLAQHIITKPVFDALFEGYDFASNNPVSKAMQGVLDVLNEQNLEKENKTLEKFYASVKLKAKGIDTAHGKQELILQLYEKFFKKAFPSMVEKLGIVYTPVEVVDFIINSVNDVLKDEFGETLGSSGVHILDPFVGTGTFITRLLESGLIPPDKLKHKFENEIHANEIVLLAYYIAAINIEATYHALAEGEYNPFSGICLTDTFQLYEKDDMISRILEDNSSRRAKQKELDIRVIIGNPPYSAGQKSGDDNAANVHYPTLDENIRTTYAKYTTATLINSLYDSYIRAVRWATDRIGNNGIVAFVTNAGWLDGNAMGGLRKCLVEDYSSLYIFHLRGDARTSGEQRRKEKDNVFGQGTRTPVAISVLVKNPDSKKVGQIFFHDIGDYLSRQDKLSIVKNFSSIKGITKAKSWQKLTPDEHNDWLNQRDSSFDEFIKLGDKKNSKTTMFAEYSSGIKTNRDTWCYNYSKPSVDKNMSSLIGTYNSEVDRYISQASKQAPIDFVDKDPKRIKWTREILKSLSLGQHRNFNTSNINLSVYRPFCKQWAFFDKYFNNCVYQMPRIFPTDKVKNRVIAVTGVGGRGFSVCIFDHLPDIQTMFNGQCFPLKLYEKIEQDGTLPLGGGKIEGDYRVTDGITDTGLKHFKEAYPKEDISKEDIFYYIYGLLHSEEYRTKYAANLTKELPRIPCVKKTKDFWTFSKAGRELAELHINYEEVKPYPVKYKQEGLDISTLSESDLRVTKMKFGPKKDKTIVVYNPKITMTDIPLEAYDYVVNGKSAIEWVMDRQQVKTDKKSGIVNDCNAYATETVGDPAYPLKLFQRVITVSLETMKIVRELPSLDLPE